MVRVDAEFAPVRRRCGGGGAATRARTSVGRVRARRESVSRGMRPASATSAAPGAPAPLHLQALGARRVKTDLHVAEPTAARSCSPAPSLRSQRAKQYRWTSLSTCETFCAVFISGKLYGTNT